MRYRNRLLGILVLAVLLIVSPLRAAASADGDGFASSEAETADGSSDSVWEENNDGDDTYISNDGTVFRIPRFPARSRSSRRRRLRLSLKKSAAVSGAMPCCS